MSKAQDDMTTMIQNKTGSGKALDGLETSGWVWISVSFIDIGGRKGWDKIYLTQGPYAETAVVPCVWHLLLTAVRISSHVT